MRKQRLHGALLGALVVAAIVSAMVSVPEACAAAKKKPQAPAMDGKRVVELLPIHNVRIEMPNGDFEDFGPTFLKSLTTRFVEGGRYIVADPPQRVGVESFALRSTNPTAEYEWVGSEVPVASVRIKVEAMSFQTGSRGNRMFYGFNERFRTKFNSGYESLPNEFPLRTVAFEPNWFDRTFDGRGGAPFDSHSGLDLGDGFEVNALFAWLAVKYALYHTELRLRVDIDAPLAGRKEFRLVNVKGEGYFFDIAGTYEQYSGGISVARRDAMEQAIKYAISGVYDALDRALKDLPLTARIDAILPDGTLLLGTGHQSDVQPGVRYEVVDRPDVLIEAISSNANGTVGGVVRGDAAAAKLGAILRQPVPVPPAARGIASMGSALRASAVAQAAPAAVETIELPWKDLPQSNLQGMAPEVTWAEALGKSLVESVFLPYRIWRYFNYDQAYKADARGDGKTDSYAGDWAESAKRTEWGKQIALWNSPEMVSSGDGPVVAVIDSGVDYNHWTIHSHLWLNPTPSSIDGAGPSGRKDYYGWDFISGDAHPYDDGYHGTEVASLVAAVAPYARVMPLKVFNPWGISSSAAIYGAFQYAVDHGAKIILCGWATRLASKAIEEGVAYARDHGVAVIAAAGDRGDRLSQVGAYPAALSKSFDNVLVVTGVSRSDQLVQVKGRFANFDPELVGLAAPGEAIRVATPRGEEATDTSTGLAAAIAAGAMARVLAADTELSAQAPSHWIERLRETSDVVPGLMQAVKGGRRLRIVE